MCAAAAVLPLALLAACGSSGSSPSSSSSAAAKHGVSIIESGSTLMFPLFGAWQTAYNTDVPDVTIATAGTGSGAGIAGASTGTVTIGASDAYLSPANIQQYPGLVNIPLTVAALMVNYNVPGVKKALNLNGTVLAQIYAGKITKWNDPAIAKLNPGVNLPAQTIVTLHRADSSGSTFLFTSYLNAQDPSGWSSSAVGTTVSWPSAPGALAETGSGGMVSACGTTKGCIAYIGISYLSKTQDAGLGEASLANKAGKFTQATTSTINAALASFSPSTPATGSQALINTSAPNGFPIVNYEYAVVKKTQPDAATAKALKAFLKWTLTTGSSSTFLGAVGFLPLPSNVETIAENLINSISG
ncbi:MAG TPA: phosphate ABC transporter substrate-binding protein PstS [Streptosporangiaceae bacterium]